LGALIANNKARRGAAFVLRSLLGIAAVWGINFALGGIGFAVGINAVTIAIITFLGIPGIVMLYGLGFFI